MADFSDRIARGVAGIVQDIRHRWEEFAWGRVVTGRAQNITIDAAGEQSLAERYGWSVPGERKDRASEPGWFAHRVALDQSHAPDRNQRQPEAGRGIDL